MLQLVFATMPRSGSEFLIKLTRLALDDQMPPGFISVTPGRFIEKDGTKLSDLRDVLAKGSAAEFFRDEEIGCAKLESPGADIVAYDLASCFPGARWLGSVRSIEKIVASHFNLKTWGWAENRILQAYVSNLTFYEHVAQTGRLFLLDIDKPERFSLPSLLSFLECDAPGPRVRDFVDNWYVVNPLRRQQQKAGEAITATHETPPDLHTLRERHPWLAAMDGRYQELCARSSHDHRR